jgi:hypothetical protein
MADNTLPPYSGFTLPAGGGGGGVTSVSVDAGELTDTGTPTAPVLGLAAAGTPGTYTSARVTTDAFGRVSAATNGARTATADPTVLDDSVSGYFAGYTWANTVTSTVFYCVSAAVGAAVWVALGASVVFATSGYFGIDTLGAPSSYGDYTTQTGIIV